MTCTGARCDHNSNELGCRRDVVELRDRGIYVYGIQTELESQSTDNTLICYECRANCPLFGEEFVRASRID